mgnify:CR=1 FL=1
MKKYLFIILLLIIPAFSLMLRPGIYTMHDFHVFRQQQFDKCIEQKSFPCRWAPDAGMGYGEPLFNFYGQTPYWIGSLFRLFNFQIIDSVKANLILTLILSAIGMFFLARKYWGNLGGLISAVFYVYAPYRAIDIWVRGALNEAYAFVLFPLIFLFLDNYLDRRFKSDLFWLIVFSTALLVTHNLSMLIIAPFLAVWTLKKILPSLPGLITAGLIIFLLSSFYLLPVLFESHLVTLNRTTADYYSYQLHWTTLKQLFVSRFWGYGGSTWGPNDTMSFSVGHLQWIIPIITLLIFIFKHPRSEALKKALAFTGLGFLAVFLTHGKSEIIWKLIPPMSYLQFPWRFLTVSTFFFSLAAGATVFTISKKIVFPLLILILILLNFNFFRPDIWRAISDRQQFTGQLWDEQRSSALSDFWPSSAPHLPADFAPSEPDTLFVTSDYAKIQYPVVYFPGWKALLDGQDLPIFPYGPLGLITARVPIGKHQVDLKYTDTPIRSLGNLVSLLTLVCLLFWKTKYVKD